MRKVAKEANSRMWVRLAFGAWMNVRDTRSLPARARWARRGLVSVEWEWRCRVIGFDSGAVAAAVVVMSGGPVR